jgi:hypothetical protein
MPTVIGSGITFGGGITIAADNTVGQQAYTTAGTYSWTAPQGVTSVCVVCVGGGGGGTRNFSADVAGNGGDSYFIDTLTVAGFGGTRGGPTSGTAGQINATYGRGGGYVGDGGGNGGYSLNGSNPFYGGGGAGGYAGNGGNGGTGDGSSNTTAGGAGAGGGGGGGSWSSGGGVGILGQGSNGAGSPAGTANGAGQATGGSGGGSGIQYPNGNNPTGFAGGAYGGGGAGTYTISGGGGGLGWKNNITVVPGQSYTVVVGAGGAKEAASNTFCGAGGSGAVRIIWGAGRAFPSTNTGNL